MLNTTSLMGRLTADPELKTTPSGVAVTSFSLAVNRSYVKQGEERQADFIDIVAWRNTAEFICRYFGKGQMIALTGSIQTRTYTDKNGKNRKVFEVLANDVYFCESKENSLYGKGDENIKVSPQSFSSGDNEDFLVISDDEDLPF